MYTYLIQSPLTIWENNEYFLVGPICDPQEKAVPIALFPKNNPESRTNAMLLKQVLYKWKIENNKSLKNVTNPAKV